MGNLDICRTCGEITRSVYSHNLYDDPSKVLLHQIEVLTGIWLSHSDQLPVLICAYCYQDLKKAVEFRERCIKIQVQFKQLHAVNYQTHLKQKRYSEYDPLVVKQISVSTHSEYDNIDKTNPDAEVCVELLTTVYSNTEIAEKIDIEETNQHFIDSLSSKSENEEHTYTDWAESPKNNLDSIDDEGTNEEQSTEQEYDDDCEWNAPEEPESEHQQDRVVSTSVKKCNTEPNSIVSEGKIKKRNTQLTKRFRNKLVLKNSPKEEERSNEEITSTSKSEIKPKRKYTFRIRKPRSDEKKKYKPTRSIYICEVCGNTYRSLFTFSEHKLKHAGVKKFKCTECPKSFLTNRCLKQHIIKHTDARPFVCRICSLTFRSRSHRNAHEKKHKNPDPHYCSFCDKKFVTLSGLQLHEASHRGVRKYHCNLCDRSFMTRKHLKTHSNTKLHQTNAMNDKTEKLDSDIEMMDC